MLEFEMVFTDKKTSDFIATQNMQMASNIRKARKQGKQIAIEEVLRLIDYTEEEDDAWISVKELTKKIKEIK